VHGDDAVPLGGDADDDPGSKPSISSTSDTHSAQACTSIEIE
jgi:hypothetical protein